MRGCFSLFTSECSPAEYRSGLFVASAELDVVCQARPALSQRWPQVKFAILAPHGYADEFTSQAEMLWLEDLKAKPLHSLLWLRRRKFDLCVVLFAGRPSFRKLKIATWLLNAGRIVFYNENGSSLVVDRKHWKQLLAYVAHRAGRLHPASLFFPFGFFYLLIRTSWLIMRARLIRRRLHGTS